MNAEVIEIGSELLLGQIIDTNSASIARSLAQTGIELVHTTTVGDDLRRMKETIQTAIHRSEVVITTGGLGPTEDDLTREAIAEAFQRPLVFQPHLMEQIEALFKKRGFRMVESNRKQAFIPEGAIPIENPKGTAPGFIVEYSNGSIISIPGVPVEMEYLMENAVIPYLRKRFDLQRQIIRYRVLRACGLGESAIGQQIKDLMKESKNPAVGTLASIGDIRIRITAKASNSEEASNLIQKMEREIRDRLGVLIYGVDDETLHGNILKELERLNLTLSTVEVFTGGIISQRLASAGIRSFVQGTVSPSETSQRLFLGLSQEEFTKLGNDPKGFAELLAQKCRSGLGTNLGLATFARIAEEQKEGEYRIETYYSLSTPTGVENQEHSIGGELWTIRERAAIMALDSLRKYLLRIAQANRIKS
ncbi:MAG TPA: CinA family nicotinamide mononucleotide deamidase-related protein [Thermodesulfobacteriota bacterium]|nr:CinA family nicotinamide mononucleotide deamidase-related protein [Thermodesulfobacteriota bacterium]